MNALGPNSFFFFLASTSDLTLCKCSLESVFYSYVNNLKYLVQMLGYWDNVLVCCYFNWTNQLLFWHDNKRWRYETPNIVIYVWTSKQGRTPQPSSRNEINLTQCSKTPQFLSLCPLLYPHSDLQTVLTEQTELL